MNSEEGKVKVKLTFYYYFNIVTCKLLAIFSENKANQRFDKLTIDMNVNSQKYIKTKQV